MFIERISKLKIILEPYFLLPSCLVQRHFIKELEEVEKSRFINDCQPTGVDLVNLLAPQFTEETVYRGLEEIVVNIVEMYIGNLKSEKLHQFFRFTTGGDTLPGSLRLTFNGNTNEEMMTPCFKENSNHSKDKIINIFDELNNASTLKDDFKQPCNEAFICSNSEPIIDFSVDTQFNRVTCENNDSNNFNSIKQGK